MGWNIKMFPIASILSGEGKKDVKLKHRELLQSLFISRQTWLFPEQWPGKQKAATRTKYNTPLCLPKHPTGCIWAFSLVQIYYTKHTHLERISNFTGEQDPRSHLRLSTQLLEPFLAKDWVKIYLSTWWFCLQISPTAFLHQSVLHFLPYPV